MGYEPIDKKNILIISKAFYPDNSPRSFRATELAKEFARLGHDVTVITKERAFDYTEFLEDHKIILKSFGTLRFKPLKKSKWIGDLKRKIGRLLFMLFYYPDIEIMTKLKKALEYERNYDLMISVAVPYTIHWGVAWAKTRNNPIARTWVADCGDPFMGGTLESFNFPFYFSFLEKWFCRKADYLSVPTEGAIHAYYPEFQHKIEVIPQGFNFEDIKLNDEKINNKVVNFAYAGGISTSGVRNPQKIIKYLLSKDFDFMFHVYPTTNSNIIKPYADISPNRIILHRPLSRKDLLFELSKMDFLINLDNDNQHQRPSKLIDYALIKKPILNVKGEDPNYMVIDQFLEKNYSGSLKISNIENYNIKNVAKKFLDLVN